MTKSLAQIRDEVLASMPTRRQIAEAATEADLKLALQRALGWVQAIDTIVDEAQESLAEALGVQNPDADETDDAPGTQTAAAVVLDFPEAGHTTITGPATLRQKAMDAAERWLVRIEGRFVGADEPNRNGALWTPEDLAYGQPTVAHGPLNWLHNERKIVGVITDSRYVERQAAASGAITAPHLRAQSILWRWLYPEEARIVERAADNSALWYSMECIAENVECRPTEGGPGCGAKFPYATYMRERAKTCEHMMRGTAPRRFENPVFQGGAIIVPPVRPGWADADAEVVRQAAGLAEKLDAADFHLTDDDLAAMLTQVAAWQKVS